MPSSTAPTVEFYFDPICPWTWLTSRWIVDVVEQTGIDVRWHALSLGLLTGSDLQPTSDTPEHLRPVLPLSTKALRVIAHLGERDRNADVGNFYTAVGTAFHVRREEPDDDLLIGALRVAGIEDLETVAGDPAADAAVEASHELAQSLLAGDSGSPVLSIDGKAIFGPIVSPAPTGSEALALWEAVQTLLTMPEFFELKRNRENAPETS